MVNNQAIDAFNSKDDMLSKNAHNVYVENGHANYKNYYIRSFCFGSISGILINFILAIMVEHSFILLFTLALCLGICQYIANLGEKKYIESEYAREKWEMTQYQQGEIDEMMTLYTKKHDIKKEDAEIIINTMAKYPDFFIDHMMIVELDLKPPTKTCVSWKLALISVITYVSYGSGIVFLDSFYALSLYLFLSIGSIVVVYFKVTNVRISYNIFQ